MVNRHVPTRSCLSCGLRAAKKELVRVVRTKEWKIEVDPTGRIPGRGAYLCKKEACWKQNLKQTRIDQTLKGKFSTKDRESLTCYYEEVLNPMVSDGVDER